MKKIEMLLILILLMCVSENSCPSNCNGHGVCSGSVCECDKSGYDNLYTGNDCRSCPVGTSFSIIYDVGENEGGGVGGNGVRILSNSSFSSDSSSSSSSARSEVSIRVLEGIDGENGENKIKIVKNLKIEYTKNKIGYYSCYDILNNYIGKMKVFGKNEEVNEYYIESEFEFEEIDMNEIICKSKKIFNDLSLYYTSRIENECNTGSGGTECKLIWKGMKGIIKNNKWTFSTGSFKFLCEGNSDAIEFTKSEEKNDDIIFTNVKVDAVPGVAIKKGTRCRLLAKIDDNNIITSLNPTTDCEYCKQPKLDKTMLKATEYYKITNLPSDILPDNNNYGIFDVYNIYSDDYLGRCSIYHSVDNNNYYIKYDFEIDSNEYIEFKYELIEKSVDISLLYSSTIDSECKIEEGSKAKCSITWNKEIKTILGISADNSGLSFVCINSEGEMTVYGGWSYIIVDNNIKFTIAESSKSIPKKGDICNLLGKVNSGNIIASLSSDALKNSLYYLKKNEEKSIQFTKLGGYDDIYRAEDIKYFKGDVGSILLCNDGRKEMELILFYEKVEDGDGVNKNMIYVNRNKNEMLSISYKCKVIKILNDYSLINPITVSSECKLNNCNLEWEGMSILELSGNVDPVTLACENENGLVNEYAFQYTASHVERRSLTEITDITLAPSKTPPIDDTKIPKANDICHVLLKKDKSVVDLSSSEYVKEIGSVILNSGIEIDKRNKKSLVYEIVNYNMNIPSDSYIGKLYCELGNGLNGDGYLMGKNKETDKENNKFILFDFEYKDIPKVNEYNCILIESYKDLSLFNEVKVYAQNGGVCYKGNCNIIWKGMNELLNKVNLGKDISGNYISGISTVNNMITTPDPPVRQGTDSSNRVQYIVCRDRVKNVKLYKYKAEVTDDKDITFSLVNDKTSYPKVGDYCSLLSTLKGEEIEKDNIYKSLYKSDYYKKNSEYKYPPLLDYDYKAIGESNPKIYRVKDLKLDDKSFSVGLLKCYNKNDGKYKGISIVYGTKDDNSYIKYEFLKNEPIASDYEYIILNKYNDLSLLLSATTESCTSESISKTCTITLNGMKSLINELYPEILNSKTEIQFACGDKSENYKYQVSESGENVIFSRSGEDLNANSNCYMLNNFDGSTIELESSDYGKLPKLKSSTAITTIGSIILLSALNMNELLINGLGEVKCYNKDVTPNSIITIKFYGKSKSNPKMNYIGFKDADKDVSEYYDCNVTNIYNDYSFYPTIKIGTNGECKTESGTNKCELTWIGMKSIIEGVGLNNKPLQFKCSKSSNDDIYIKLTTNKEASTSADSEIQAANENLKLYLSTEDENEKLPTDTGYECSLYVYSNGSNINPSVLPIIENAIDESDKDKFIYEVSNVNFKNEKGIGYKECKVNGKSERLLFMGKNGDNRYIKFNSRMDKGTFVLECEEKETILNDLSNYYEIDIPSGGSGCTSSSCSLTLTGMFPLFKSVGFFGTGEENSETKGGLSLACKTDSEDDYTVYGKFSASKDSNTNVKLTRATGDTIQNSNKCHLLSDFNGNPITDSTTSDYAKSLIIKSKTSFGGRNIFKVKNFEKIKFGDKIGELRCINKNNKIPIGTGYLMGYSDSDGFYIDYSFTSNPTPYNYECEIEKEYKDLSLLYEIEYDSENNEIDLSDIANILPKSISNGDSVVCKNSLTSKLTVYSATYNSGTPSLSFSPDADPKPSNKDKCYLLIKTDGSVVKLSESDYGKFNGIKSDSPSEEVVVKVDTSAVIIKKEEVEIPKAIENSMNGLIKCYDKESKEYLGDGEILGENSEGEIIIKYYFGNVDGSKIEPSLLEIVPTIVRNDYSTTQTPEIMKKCRGNECVAIWNEMKLVLNNLFSSSSPSSSSSSGLLRNLKEENNCINGIGLDTNRNEIKIEICCNELNNDLWIRLLDENKEMSVGEKIYPSIGRSGSIPVKSCEAYKILKSGSGGIEYSEKEIKAMNKVKKFLFNKNSFDTRQLYPGNIITMNLALVGTSKADTPYTITGVEKNFKVDILQPRLLIENERILTETIYDFAVDVSKWNDLQETQGQTISVSFPSSSSSGGVNNRLIECSGVGICDRENGICKCNEGFSGSACERMNCYKNCNNHGKCVKMEDIVNESPSNIFGSVSDDGKIYGCLCDLGYRGVDCSLKECGSDSDDRDCSNNGICDYESGECKCFDGYYGESCELLVGTS